MRTMMLAGVYLNELQQIHELLPRTDLNTMRTGGLCATLLK